MAPPFSARRPSPGFQPVYSRPRLVQQGAVYIPLSGYVVSFSALLTCLSPRNSVRTCALARVEGSVPPTSGFGIRRSPLSYTRILFERVRICTSQRGSIGRVYLTTRPPGLPPSVSPYQSASTLFRHRSMVQRPVPLPSI